MHAVSSYAQSFPRERGLKRGSHWSTSTVPHACTFIAPQPAEALEAVKRQEGRLLLCVREAPLSPAEGCFEGCLLFLLVTLRCHTDLSRWEPARAEFGVSAPRELLP